MTVPEYIRDYVDTTDITATLGLGDFSWGRAMLDNGQIKPEFLINLNAMGIIFFQVLISYFVRKTRPLTSIIIGVGVTVLSFLIYLVSDQGWIVVAAVLVFSVGEMLASPRSKEYAGRIAPPEKVGMYMGYFYWCVALGNLFGGLLSGVCYQHYGPSGTNRPDIMWLIFAGLAAFTAVTLVIYDRWAKRTLGVPQTG